MVSLRCEDWLILILAAFKRGEITLKQAKRDILITMEEEYGRKKKA